MTNALLMVRKTWLWHQGLMVTGHPHHCQLLASGHGLTGVWGQGLSSHMTSPPTMTGISSSMAARMARANSWLSGGSASAGSGDAGGHHLLGPHWGWMGFLPFLLLGCLGMMLSFLLIGEGKKCKVSPFHLSSRIT